MIKPGHVRSAPPTVYSVMPNLPVLHVLPTSSWAAESVFRHVSATNLFNLESAWIATTRASHAAPKPTSALIACLRSSSLASNASINVQMAYSSIKGPASGANHLVWNAKTHPQNAPLALPTLTLHCSKARLALQLARMDIGQTFRKVAAIYVCHRARYARMQVNV
jgi:hypothetical protein